MYILEFWVLNTWLAVFLFEESILVVAFNLLQLHYTYFWWHISHDSGGFQPNCTSVKKVPHFRPNGRGGRKRSWYESRKGLLPMQCCIAYVSVIRWQLQLCVEKSLEEALKRWKQICCYKKREESKSPLDSHHIAASSDWKRKHIQWFVQLWNNRHFQQFKLENSYFWCVRESFQCEWRRAWELSLPNTCEKEP